MSARCPTYLATRLQVLRAHMRDIAVERGLLEAFGERIAVATAHAEQALEAGSKAMVEGAIREQRELALALYTSSPPGDPAAPDESRVGDLTSS